MSENKRQSRNWFKDRNGEWRRIPEEIKKREQVTKTDLREIWGNGPTGTINGYEVWQGDAQYTGISEEMVGAENVKWTPDVRSGLSPVGMGSGGGGNPTDAQKDRLDAIHEHTGGYDPVTNSAADPNTSASKGFNPEEWYANEATNRQQDRLTGENGPFNEDGTVEDSNVAGSSGGSDPPTLSTGSDNSNSSDSTPVPDEVADYLPDGIEPKQAALGVTAVAAVYMGVIR